ncbi:MAG: MATE family efflux transporter [Tissierellia bacterium]|nr:MATE family efflux transporter [Tissierellia bacterium]
MDSDLSKEQLRKSVILLALPVLLELVISNLFGMVDMIMVGNSDVASITTPSIAAIGITNQVMFIGTALAQALSTGGTALIARYFGANKPEKIQPVVKHVILVTVLFLAIPFLAIGLSFSENLMGIIGAEADAINVGLGYFRVVIFGFLFQGYNLAIFASFRGAGDTKTPMMVNISVNLLNVIGNAILVFGLFGAPKLGVLGAGISTTFAHIVASIVLTTILLSKKRIIAIDFKEKFRFNNSIVKNLFAVGGPAAMEQVAFRVGVIMFIRIVSGLGTLALATHQITLNILSLSFSPGQAFGIASSTLVGKSLGENKPDKAKEYMIIANRLAFIFATFIGVLFFFFGKHVTALYTQDQAIIVQSIDILRLMAFIQPFQASQLCLAGGLRGAGDTVWTLIITFFSVVVVRLSVAYVLVYTVGLGLKGAWIAMFVDQLVRWAGVTLRFRTDKWKYVKLS